MKNDGDIEVKMNTSKTSVRFRCIDSMTKGEIHKEERKGKIQ